ncbi:Glucose-1-phosphate adenylyltransferase large subunit 1 [Spatholobus suberectus]|nr:Glucose-1-phosphate adenylyltransferase large subunit 1 [Spatholobus suberectus]
MFIILLRHGKFKESDLLANSASMGLYVFKKEILLNLLRWLFPSANDFGSEVIPASAREFLYEAKHCMQAYLFNNYWEDIGTIRSFFEANRALTEHVSIKNVRKPFHQLNVGLIWEVLGHIVDSIIPHGSFVTNSLIEHSVVGIRFRINSTAPLKDTVTLGADFYETDAEVAALDCIIDKNARIGKNAVIANSEIFDYSPLTIGGSSSEHMIALDRKEVVGIVMRINNKKLQVRLQGIQEADRSSQSSYIRSGITIVLKNVQ